MRTRSSLIAAAALLLTAAPIVAHHALAVTYDTRQSVVMTGTITRIAWDNPHVHLFLAAEDKKTPHVSWEFEMGSPNLLMLNGWKIDTFRRGDHVVVTAYPARDGSPSGYASKVALSSH